MKKLVTTIAAVTVSFMPFMAFAQEEADRSLTMASQAGGGYWFIAKALAIGLAAIGGALGQGKLVSAALEGIARNPGAAGQIFTPMILGIAFVESLVIFALVIAFTM